MAPLVATLCAQFLDLSRRKSTQVTGVYVQYCLEIKHILQNIMSSKLNSMLLIVLIDFNKHQLVSISKSEANCKLDLW